MRPSACATCSRVRAPSGSFLCRRWSVQCGRQQRPDAVCGVEGWKGRAAIHTGDVGRCVSGRIIPQACGMCDRRCFSPSPTACLLRRFTPSRCSYARFPLAPIGIIALHACAQRAHTHTHRGGNGGGDGKPPCCCAGIRFDRCHRVPWLARHVALEPLDHDLSGRQPLWLCQR